MMFAKGLCQAKRREDLKYLIWHSPVGNFSELSSHHHHENILHPSPTPPSRILHQNEPIQSAFRMSHANSNCANQLGEAIRLEILSECAGRFPLPQRCQLIMFAHSQRGDPRNDNMISQPHGRGSKPPEIRGLGSLGSSPQKSPM